MKEMTMDEEMMMIEELKNVIRCYRLGMYTGEEVRETVRQILDNTQWGPI